MVVDFTTSTCYYIFMPELTHKEVASRGGQSTLAKYGSEYFKELQAKRKNRRGKYSKEKSV